MFFFKSNRAGGASSPVFLKLPRSKTSAIAYDEYYPYAASLGQRKLGLVFCIALVLSTLALRPFADMPAGPISSFFSTQYTPSIVSCLITAYLMFVHFRSTRSIVLLRLSASYFYAASILIMQSMALRGDHLFGSSHRAIWLWGFWHLGLTLSILYIGGSYRGQLCQRAPPGGNALRNTVLGWLTATAATAVLAFGLGNWPPVLNVAQDSNRTTITGIALALVVLLGIALLLLWRANRFRNVLHLWLGVVIVSFLCEITLITAAGSPLMLGWYAGRTGALIGFSVITLAYLQELKNAYLTSLTVAKQLAISNEKLDLEGRDRSLYVESLMQANQRKDQFLAMLAHELRNPLAPINSAAELLSLGNLSQEMIYKTSSIITRQINHMTGLVDDLLDVSRVNNGLIVLSRSQVDIKQVIADAYEQVRPFIAIRQHRIMMQLTSEPTWVFGDHKRLVQIIANLLNNSVKYTPENGNISVHLDATETHIEINIADDGIGISSHLLTNMFELFVQGERTLDRSQGGLGLGLAIVKNLVKLHGGSVSAQSDGNDKGSELKIRLPRLSVKIDRSPHAEPAPAVSQIITSKAFVLIVDDNIDAAEMLGAFLKAKGFRVVVAHGAAEALTRAKQEKFDAFLVDIGMPGMNGCDLVQRLRTLPLSRTKLMVAVTGYGNEVDRKTILAAGFDVHLVKPADLKKILELLEKITLG